MKIFLIFFVIIPLLILITVFIFNAVYDDFINKYSKRIIALKEINDNTHFYPRRNFDLSHKYDSRTFYNEVSCQDYLIYQLQFNKNEIKKYLSQLETNEKFYKDYVEKYSNIPYSHDYLKEIPRLFIKKILNHKEDKIFNKSLKSPALVLKISVHLSCYNMAGHYLNSKDKVFDKEEILHLIKCMEPRNGFYYLNRSIWEAVCRVERARVTNKMRFYIYERDGYRCKMCHRRYSKDHLEIDHIKPIAKGGKSTMDNLQTLCHRCNQLKGSSYNEH